MRIRADLRRQFTRNFVQMLVGVPDLIDDALDQIIMLMRPARAVECFRSVIGTAAGRSLLLVGMCFTPSSRLRFATTNVEIALDFERQGIIG